MKNNKKKRLKIIFKSWWFSLIVAILIATSFKSAIADWNDIPTGSMKPTILIGDRIIINKLAYDLKIPYTTLHLAQWANPKHGDIVVFYSPEDGKRLIETETILSKIKKLQFPRKQNPNRTLLCLIRSFESFPIMVDLIHSHFKNQKPELSCL